MLTKFFFLLNLILWVPLLLSAQVQSPNRRYTFTSDDPLVEKKRRETMKDLSDPGGQASKDLDFQAPEVQFFKEKNEIHGKGGILISQGGIQIQADEGQVNMNTKDADVRGHVSITSPEGTLNSSEAKLNMETESGLFKDAEFTLEEGGFDIRTGSAKKLSEFEYELEDSNFSSCHCLDQSRPWEIRSSSCNITQEGYAHTYNSGLWFHDVPVFYSPWLAFPAKMERQSGVLQGLYGWNNRDGLRLNLPIFGVIDDSSDVTIEPFIASRSRYGAGVEYRETFSERSLLKTRLIYSDESAREGSPRGLNFEGLSDPKIDTHRLGGYYYHVWRPDPELDLPMEFLADGRYVSDTSFLREIPDDRIGEFNSRFLTSQAVLRGQLWDSVGAELRAEGNQDLITDTGLARQRLPEFTLTGQESFKPFGQNPFGFKVVTTGLAQVTNFVRLKESDGVRVNLNPGVAIPFRLSNVVRAQVFAKMYHLNYSLRDRMQTNNGVLSELPSSSSQTTAQTGALLSSSFERVYDLDKGNWFSNVVGLGSGNAGNDLVRLKHVIEPFTQYNHVPGVAQGDTPFFDVLDRFQQKSLLTYGVRTRLLGRFLTPATRTRPIGELVPSMGNLPTLDVSPALDDFSRDPSFTLPTSLGNRAGEVRELMSLTLRQGYDYFEDTKNIDPFKRPMTDWQANYTFTPSNYFGFALNTNYSQYRSTFSQYDVGVSFRDDRDDVLRLTYNFVDKDAVSGVPPEEDLQQLESNLEIRLTPRVKAGFYGNYDQSRGGFLEKRGLLRLMSECNCWSIDFGYSNRVNPNIQQVLVSFTLSGLGDITQNFGVFRDPNPALQQP